MDNNKNTEKHAKQWNIRTIGGRDAGERKNLRSRKHSRPLL